MIELDGQEVISALSMAIRAAFTTTEIVKLYKDTPEQGMQKPCVFLRSISFDPKTEMSNRSRWNYIIEIRCHPADGSTEVETWARGMAVRLLGVISSIRVSGQVVKATAINCTTQGGVLQLIANYSFGVLKTSDEIVSSMDTVEYGVHIQ